MILSLIAMVGAGFARAATIESLAPSGKMTALSHASDAHMPCCPAKAPASCVSDLGCVFLVGLPALASVSSSHLAWSLISHRISQERGRGRSLQPDLGPPILLS